MSLIQIFANGIALDFVKETLTVKKENNAFITDLKVSHSSYPFLIIENQQTKNALGPRDIASVIRRKVITVYVIEAGEKYFGQLEVLSYTEGFRKCNLKYGSVLIDGLEKKLQDLLPVVSIIPGETNPVAYSDEATELVEGYDEWDTFPMGFINKIFPEVNYCFPTMVWPDKFGDDEEWATYMHLYNNYNTLGPRYRQNTFSIIDDLVELHHFNVPSPQLFLLGILKIAFAYFGYTIDGDFVASDFARRLLVLSTKDNLCKVPIAPDTETLDFTDFPFAGTFGYRYYIHHFNPTAAGDYVFNYSVTEPLRTGGEQNITVSGLIYGEGDNVITDARTTAYKNRNIAGALNFNGSFTITVGDEQVGNPFFIAWMLDFDAQNILPTHFEITNKKTPVNFYMMHPTIALGRYAPDKSLSNYVNDIKNLFNLDITFNDQQKKVSFNFAEQLAISNDKFVINRSLAYDEYTPAANTAFVLMYGNSEDSYMYIDRNGPVNNKSYTEDFTSVITNGFKLVPLNNFSAVLSTIDDKDGVGLMIYNPVQYEEEEFNWPVISPDYLGQRLSMIAEKGIYNSFWKTSLKIRLNAGAVEVKEPFTENEIAAIARVQKVYLDNQAYNVLSIEYSETKQSLYLVTLQLESITI